MPDKISGYKATPPLAPLKGSKGNAPVADQSGSDSSVSGSLLLIPPQSGV